MCLLYLAHTAPTQDPGSPGFLGTHMSSQTDCNFVLAVRFKAQPPTKTMLLVLIFICIHELAHINTCSNMCCVVAAKSAMSSSVFNSGLHQLQPLCRLTRVLKGILVLIISSIINL